MKRAMTSLHIVLGLAALAAPAWGQAGRDASPATKTAPGPLAARPGDAAARAELSEAECRAYAQAVVKALTAGNTAELNDLVDWEAIFKTTADGLAIPDATRQGVLAGMKRMIVNGEHGLPGQLARNVAGGGGFRFLRARRRDGRQVVLFRLVAPMGQGGVKYLEFAPRRYPGSKVRATDIYFYVTGEFYTETMRRLILPVLADQSRSFLDKLLAGEKDYVHDFPEVGRAGRLLSEGKAAEALAIYKSLHPETRKQKAVLLGRIGAAQAADDDREYATGLDEYRKLFPDDPSLELLEVNAFFMLKDFPGAMKAIDRLDRSVEGDPYLDLLRAGLCETKGDREGSRRFARRAVNREPSLLQAHWASWPTPWKTGNTTRPWRG